MRIDEKYTMLSPAGQDAVLAFVDFLLSREEKRDRRVDEEEYNDESPLTSPEPTLPDRENPLNLNVGRIDNSGIILAEERIIDDKNDIIDFADINSRFSQDEKNKDTPTPVRQRKMFDWL